MRAALKSLRVQICLGVKSNECDDLNNRIRLGYSELLKPTLREKDSVEGDSCRLIVDGTNVLAALVSASTLNIITIN